MDNLVNERNKSKGLNILPFKGQEEWIDRDEELHSSLEQIEIDPKSKESRHLTHELNVPHEEPKSVQIAQNDVFKLNNEIQLQKQEIEQLKREKELLHLSLEGLRGDLEQKPGESKPNLGGINDIAILERELQLVRDQTNLKLSEFDAVKAALLKDLENRCQKVIELEILLDEAREQYQTLLVQVKNSNSKTLQQKCIFLQRNLEQLTTVQQQLVNENNRLKLENQVYVKQLAIRNERIHGLELLLQDAQEKLQKHASSGDPGEDKRKSRQGASLSKGTGVRKGAVALNLTGGGRIAKPLRGGGGGSTTPAVTSPIKSQEEETVPSEPRKGGSIWDLFRGSKRSDDSQSPTTPGSPSVTRIPTDQT